MSRTKREYSNGYIGKIAYWSNKLVVETETTGDMGNVVMIMEKLKYFTARQLEVYGNPTKKQSPIEKLDLGNGNIIYGV